MTATTAIITGTLTHEEKAVVDAYVEVVRTATDADLNTFAAYHRNKIDKAFANGGNTGRTSSSSASSRTSRTAGTTATPRSSDPLTAGGGTDRLATA